ATGAHRLVQIEGALAGKPNETGGEGSLDWRIDATVAFGGAPRNQIEAAVDLRFANLPFDTLLAHPSREQWRTQIVGGLHDLVVQTRYCPSHEDDVMPLLDACARVDPNDPRRLAGDPLHIDLSLAHVWYRGRDSAVGVGGEPGLDRGSTCSLEPLVARLEGTQLSLARPWKIRSGGGHGPVLEVDGTFDLSDADQAELADQAAHADSNEAEPVVAKQVE